jgi:nucleoside-diphosphate-sugar epimerase
LGARSEGFIESFLAARLLAEGSAVARIDNLNDYYDPALENARLARPKALNGFEFFCGDLANVSFVGLWCKFQVAIFDKGQLDHPISLYVGSSPKC